jgi:hypothetical protein
MDIVMKLPNKAFLLTIIAIYPLICSGQESFGIYHDITGYYGIFSFQEVNDAYLYKSTFSTGVYGLRYILHLDQKYAIGIEGGYENTEPILKGSQPSENFYIKTFFFTGRLNYTLIERKRFALYVAGAFGIKQIDKKLIDEKEIYTELAKEITLLGLQFKILQRTHIVIELTNGDMALLKFGLSYRFGENKTSLF